MLGEEIDNTFDEVGNLLTTTDAIGRVLEYRYDDFGRPIGFIDPDGNTSAIAYNEFGYITSTTDFLGNEVNYTYDNRGNRLTETYTATFSGGVAEELAISYTYDNEGRITATEDPAGNVTRFEYDANNNLLALTDARGQRTEYVYNDRNLLVETIFDDETPEDSSDNLRNIALYDRGGRTRAQIDAAGNALHYVYDALGRVTEVIYSEASETLEQLLAAIAPNQTLDTVDWSQVVYPDEPPAFLNDNLREISEYYGDGKVRALTDRAGNRTEFRYDLSDRLVETIFADDTPEDSSDNLRSITLYDRSGRLRAQIDAGGNALHYVYDEVGRLTETIYPTESDSLEQLLEAIAPGQTLDTVDWTQVVYPDAAPAYLAGNPRIETEYFNNDRVQSQTDQRGNITEFRYDALGRLTETILADDTPETLVDNPRLRTEYNEIGQVLQQIDPLGQATTFAYNRAGDLVQTTFDDGTTVAGTFNEIGQAISATDQEGNTTSYDYDNFGRLTSITDALDQRTEYTYDNLSLLTETTDANGITTSYDFDSFGRRTGIELPEGEEASYSYDANGNLATYTDFNGNATRYEYNALNQLVTTDFANDADVTYTYTDTGQIETITDGRGVTRFEYDHRDRLVSRTDPDGSYIRPGGPTIEYTYDEASNRTSVSTPNGTTTYTFDAQNRLETVTDPNQGVTTYQYDLAGRLTLTEFANGTEERRGYDNLNRLTRLTTVQIDAETGEETVIAGFEYTLNNIGHRLQITEHDGRITQYEYDDVYRLTQERILDPDDPTNDGRTIDYTYDALGNRLTRIDSLEGLTTYAYNDDYQLLQEVRSLNGDVTNTITYSYDANGNLLSRTSDTSGTTRFIWNDSNRLVGVELPNGDEISYIYDQAGIQVSSTINSETTTYVVDSNRPFAQVLESITSDDLVQISVFGLDLIAQLQGDQSSFFHTDGLGSTRVVTDGEGTVQQEFDYLAFGELLGARNAEQVDNLFAGEQFEQELGLYHLRQRYYDPSTGRFISRDAFEGFITNPISQNRYLYANANPVTYTDPSGFFSIGNVSAASVARGTLSVISSPQFLLGAGIGAGAQVTGDFARGERSTVLGVLGAAAFGGLGFVFGPALAGALLKSASGTVGLSLLVANGLADSFNTLRAGLSSGDPLRAFAGVTSALLDFGLLDGALNPRSLLRNPLRGARGFARSIGGLSDNIARQGGDLVDNIIGNILDNGRNAADNALDGAPPTRPDTIQCFVSGTHVLTPHGKTAIDSLRPGDWVISWDEETGEVSQRQVTEWYERQAPVIIDLFIGTEKISCTPEHPFWVKGRGWMRASQLTVGTILQTRAGEPVSIDAVRKHDEPTNIYNVEITGLHTYFVSNLEILSHNMCGGTSLGGKITGDPDIVASKARIAADPTNPNSLSAQAELSVAKQLRAEGENVHFIDDSLSQGQAGPGLTNDFTLLNSGVQADVKRLSGIGRNAAGDLAKGVRQVGSGGQVLVVRASNSQNTLAQFQDFINNFTPSIPGVTFRLFDESSLPR
ncbi:polymorphic toxin-type HINT domain-containing protein [Synechococcus sp. PCC 7336]|uniref:polymorphic toxin-type HINT domain-containing protein n=1 Tax=Synechococcus sp. PCC 7336 TaxID=195250 RepID=UPI000349E89D|nr:polymorphic toxin-type HINT domain-containing protein [Synechococcus sp. PCC 7336]